MIFLIVLLHVPPVLWIRDILVRIRIRTLLFCQQLTSQQKKLRFFFEVFCLLLFEGTFKLVFKDKTSKNSRNQGFFLLFWLFDGRIRIRIRKAQKRTDPPDLDPQHCIPHTNFNSRAEAIVFTFSLMEKVCFSPSDFNLTKNFS